MPGLDKMPTGVRPAPHDRLSRASPEEYHTGFVPVFDRLQEARQVLAAGYIQLRGVRVHNLKSVDLDLPHRKLIVFCGVSGSGEFCEKLLKEKGLLVIPGGPFGLDNMIRFSFAAGEETLTMALDRFESFVSDYS